MSSNDNHSRPHAHKVAPLIALVVLLALAFGFFKFLSGDGVMDATRGGTFTGSATILDTKIKGQKCYLEIRREDGVKELRATGYRNECGKYEIGQKVEYVQGLIQ